MFKQITGTRSSNDVAIVGCGIVGALAALSLAESGRNVVVFESQPEPLSRASRVNEGKIHLGYVYANDPSLRTARRMIAGALSFRMLLERWIESAEFDQLVTDGFDYVVPPSSQRTPDEIRHHFTAVASLVREAEAKSGLRYLDHPDSARWSELNAHCYAENEASACFETNERAVDTRRIAQTLARCLNAHPRIEVVTNSPVVSIEPDRGGWKVRGKGLAPVGPFVTVINASWQGRRALDARSGFPDPSAWMTRFKCSLDFQLPADWAPAEHIKNFTAILGTFGDCLIYPTGRAYLSWYPAGLVMAETSVEPGEPVIPDELKSLILQESLSELAKIQPSVSALSAFCGPKNVAGGFIVALGRTDIADPRSGLHERHRVGVTRLADGYFSVDPGKYTLAPLVADECVSQVLGIGTADVPALRATA
jgi:FAD dependent oxidoreductase